MADATVTVTEDTDEQQHGPDESQQPEDQHGPTGDEKNHDDSESGGDDDADPEGADQLGDPGKKALASMKAERNAAKKQAKELQKQLDQIRAEQERANKSPDEQAIDAAKAEARAEALEKANARILRSELKAAATGKLRDPSDALAFLDLSEFEVDDDGNVDADELADALDDLLTRKPHLAAQGGTASFDSARGKPKPRKKLSKADLEKMTPAEVTKAYREGRVDT